jgi:hypothetical protein
MNPAAEPVNGTVGRQMSTVICVYLHIMQTLFGANARVV